MNLINLNKIPYWSNFNTYEKGLFLDLVMYCENLDIPGCLNDENELMSLFGIKQSTISYENIQEITENKISDIMFSAFESILYSDSSISKKRDIKISYDDWLYFLWCNKWKNKFLRFFKKIEKSDIKKNPILKDKIGCLFSSSIYDFCVNSKDNVVNVKKITKKNNYKKNIINIGDFIYNDNYDFISNEALEVLSYNPFFIKNELTVLKTITRKLTEEENYNIWSLGVDLITESQSKNDLLKARSKISALNKKYGFSDVSIAIAEISSLPQKPANVYAVLINKLKNKQSQFSKENILIKKAKRLSSNIQL